MDHGIPCLNNFIPNFQKFVKPASPGFPKFCCICEHIYIGRYLPSTKPLLLSTFSTFLRRPCSGWQGIDNEGSLSLNRSNSMDMPKVSFQKMLVPSPKCFDLGI